MYHCPKGKSSNHPKGYDYCMKCARHKSKYGKLPNSILNKSKSNIDTINAEDINPSSRYKVSRFEVTADTTYPDVDKTIQALDSLVSPKKTLSRSKLQSINRKIAHFYRYTYIIYTLSTTLLSNDYECLKAAIVNNVELSCICHTKMILTFQI